MSDMFSAGNIGATKLKVEALRAYFPGLLHRKANAGGAPNRQMTLRFAAWLLTAHITYSPNDPSRGNFRDWLRWLTYIKKEHPKAHNKIRNKIEDNLAVAYPKPMVFTWTKKDIEELEVNITDPTMAADFYVIEVIAKDGPSTPATDEDDTDHPPSE